MICPSCKADNLQGADACEECGLSLFQEDIPLGKARSELERRLHGDTVKSLQPREPISIGPGATILDAVNLMRERGIGCVLVAREGRELLGILTEADLIRRISDPEGLTGQTVSDVMTADPESLECHHPLAYVLQRMRVTDCRHLPVVNEDGVPIGVVSSRDVLNFLDDALYGVED